MPVLLIALAVALCANALIGAEPATTEPDYPLYELEIITAKPGKLDALQDWFKQHDHDVLAKHGAKRLAYLV